MYVRLLRDKMDRQLRTVGGFTHTFLLLNFEITGMQ